MTEPIEMPFVVLTLVNPRNHVLDTAADPSGEGNFLGECTPHHRCIAQM